MIYTNDENLHLAAEQGDIEKIKELVEKGMPIDIRNEENNTPIQHIVRNNLADTKTIKTLFDLGAGIEGWFAMGEAAIYGNVRRLKQLFDLNPNLINEKWNGQGVLDLAMMGYRLAKKEVNTHYSYPASKELASMVKTVSALVKRGSDISEYEYMENHPENNPEIVNIIENVSKIRSNYTYFKKHHKKVSDGKIAEIKEMQYE